MGSKDFYEILGVARDASADDVRRAYRRLARENHPDRNPGDAQAEERFKDITRAYEVLGDEGKRKVYDEFGAEAEAIDFDPEKARTYRQWAEQQARYGEARPSGGKGGAGQPDLSSIFEDLMRGSSFDGFGGTGFGPRGRPGPVPGPDIRTKLSIGFKEALLGAEQRISLERPGPSQPCGRCGGSGRIVVTQGGLQLQIPCDACGGEGWVSGALERTTLDVKIPPGVDDGQVIRLKGQGAPGLRGGERGDLLIELAVAEHPRLRRDGRDLHLDVPITLREAMLGGNVEIPCLDGRRVRIRVPAGVRPGQKLRIKGKGVEGAKGPAGDLYAHLIVALPVGVDPENPGLREAVEQIEKLYGGSVREELEKL